MNKFQILGKVGEGAFASVYKVKRKEDGLIYAMKKIKISNGNHREISNCLNEVRILASITNPYILAYKEAVYDDAAGCLLLITEFAYGGDLSGLIRSHQKKKQYMEEAEIWRMAMQMLHGLKTLHRMNIFHRDIKSANLLLTSNNTEVKLGDLNVSKISKSGMASTQTGTPYYASPEVWQDMPYNAKCDIWSMGCVLYEMCTFRPPFTANDLNGLKKRIIAGHYDRISQFYSEDLQNFIRLCLTTNSKERPSAETLLQSTQIRKRIYLYPNERFNQATFQSLMNKENKLLQTIRVPNKYNFGSDLKSRLPKSNYENSSEVLSSLQKNKSLALSRNHSEQRLPQVMRRQSSKQAVKQKQRVNIPKHRMVHLR